MDPARETANERGGGPVSVSNVLSGSGAGGITIWGRYLGFSSEISQKMEGAHVGFLRKMTGKKVKRQRDGNWRIKALAKALKEARTQTLGAYIDKRQEMVAEWVTLRPILNICDRETGYVGGGRRRDPWRRQTAARKHLSTTL